MTETAAAEDTANASADEAADIYAAGNPAFAACVIASAARGYEEADGSPEGLLVPWGILVLGYVSTAKVRDQIPRSGRSILRILMYKTHPERRLDSAPTILAWRDSFWQGIRYGISRGALTSDGVRVWHSDELSSENPELADALAAARALGKLLGKVPDDVQRARILGVELIE